MFPDAVSADDLVLLYSFSTILGGWEIHTPVNTFRFQPIKQVNEFFLFWNEGEEPVERTTSVIDAIIAVSQHRTDIVEWDDSSFDAPDDLNEWNREVLDRTVFNFIDYWMEQNPQGSLRQMVEYFEHEDTCLIDRIRIGGFVEEMIVTGQMTRLPGVWMAPAEMSSVIELATAYGIPKLDDQSQAGSDRIEQ
jgi:hypothetical protein